jgi:hypothetical protein
MSADILITLSEVALELHKLIGLEVVLCGSWLWVSGNTKEHKEELKELGLRWAPNKEKWYLAGEPRRGRKPMDWSYIKEKYGEEVLQAV